MTAINFSAIAMGALATLFVILFGGSSIQRILRFPPADLYNYILLVVLVLVVLVFLTAKRGLTTVTNLGIGLVVFVLAYQFEVIQETFVDGRILFIGAFLAVVAVYGRRVSQIEP